jgi:aminopeptidase N
MLLALSGACTLEAQRLPTNVRPEHYTLTLTPDLKKAVFSGDETIELSLAQPMNAITLNAAEIDFNSVTANVGGKELKAEVSADKQKQQATFTFPQQLPAGAVTLHIAYTGILNNELRGFYLSKTAKRNYAVTQFEPTDARRAFPSFDEPAYKATFNVTLVVDKGDTAISNTNIIADTPGPAADQHSIHFATTPKMSTYLVAFLVGDFKCVSGESDGVPIRACATPDKVEYGSFALEAAKYVLHYYDTYFGIKYPMPKLDMIAIPDFEAGAMENFGAITYRETDLLIDEKTASVSSKKNVGLVVAHEMAHQWFGDMVTMQWWDNLWLNEGFATWMENKPVEAWKPEWNIAQDVAEGQSSTLNLDAQRVTRTIRAEANTPDQINEMFDGITYGKAGAMLLMVENYVGEDVFRQGVHNYLAAHIYGNATAEDFWNAQTSNSQKPVDKIMESFVAQPGEPLLTFAKSGAGTVDVSQKRFFLNPKAEADAQQSWTVPVCFKIGIADKSCDLLRSPQQQLKPPPAPFLFANAAGKGYYRTAYDPADYSKLLSNVESGLQPTERISVVGNEFALVRAGESSVGDFLNLAEALKQDDSADVISSVASGVQTTYSQIAETEEERQQIAAWVRTTFESELKKVGMPTPSDTPERRELRATLFGLLGGVGDDPYVINASKEIAQQYLSNPSSVDATLAQPAMDIAATHGDAAFFDLLQKTSETSNNPEVSEGALRALAMFQDPALEKRGLAYAVSGKVRNQDSVIQFVIAMHSRKTRDEAWQYIQANWPQVKAQITTAMGGYLVGSAGGFCTAEKNAEVTSFFTTNKVPAAERALKRAQDQISDCMDLRAAQNPKLKEWLATKDKNTTSTGQ